MKQMTGIFSPMGRRLNRRGVTLWYASVVIVVMAGMTSFSVDYGRVQLVSSELRAAADAAACAAVAQLGTGPDSAIAIAKSTALLNVVENTAVTLLDADIELGTWDEDAKTFTILIGAARSGADAVRVTAYRTQARNNAVPLMFGQMIGKSRQDVVATAIACLADQTSEDFAPMALKSVPGRASPWNAGLPGGVTWGDFNDTTPNCSPVAVTEVPLTAGKPILFRNGDGQTQFGYGSSSSFSIEGDTGWILDQTAQNGFGRTRAPAHALMGVFLNASDPRTSAAPGQLNFNNSKKRNFGTLYPKLKQVFYIGDGKNSSDDYQQFVVPTGTTRLFIGIMDERGRWSDNSGQISVEVGLPPADAQNAGLLSNTTRIVR